MCFTKLFDYGGLHTYEKIPIRNHIEVTEAFTEARLCLRILSSVSCMSIVACRHAFYGMNSEE